MPTSSTPPQPHLLAGEWYCSVWLTLAAFAAAAVLLALPVDLLPTVAFEISSGSTCICGAAGHAHVVCHHCWHDSLDVHVLMLLHVMQRCH